MRSELYRRARGEGVHAGFGDADVCLQGHCGVVDRCADEDYTAAGAVRAGRLAVGSVFFGGGDESGEGGFEGVVAAEDVDVDDGFESIRAELVDGCEEVACCAGSIVKEWMSPH